MKNVKPKIISLLVVFSLVMSALFITTSSNALYETPVFESSFGSYGTGNGQFSVVAGIATNPSTGELYVADRHNARVQVFDADGTYQRQFTTTPGSGGAFFPVDIAINNDGSKIFVADFLNQTIRVFNSNEVEIDQVGSAGSGAGQFGGYPIGITLNSNGSQLVAYETGADPTYNHQIHVFSDTGSSVSDWATGTSGTAQYIHPAGLAISADDSTLYVADSDNSNIQLFDLLGNPKSTPTLGSAGSGAGQFNQISEIAISPDQSTLFVSDSDNQRVQMFDLSDLDFLGEFGLPGDFAESGGLAFSVDGTKLFVVDAAARSIAIHTLTESIGGGGNNVDDDTGGGGTTGGSSETPKPPKTGALLGAGLVTVSILVLILLVTQEIETKHLGKERSKNKFH